MDQDQFDSMESSSNIQISLLNSCENLYCKCLHALLSNLTVWLAMSVLISENQNHFSQKASIIKPDVELIGIINSRGRLIDSIGHGIIDIPEDKKEMFLMKIALRNSMQQDFDEDLGTVNYCMTLRGNTKYISIPATNGNTILAVTKKEANHEELVAGINQILRYSNQFLGEKITHGITGEKNHE